jgi:hypothetical protein
VLKLRVEAEALAGLHAIHQRCAALREATSRGRGRGHTGIPETQAEKSVFQRQVLNVGPAGLG